MRVKRLKVRGGIPAVYHCMSRTVNGESLFGDREKEVLRKMLWQVSDFSGVEVLTYALMDNHFHVLVRIQSAAEVSDAELMRRWRRLYPKPTKYETASAMVMERKLAAGGEEAEAIRERLLARMCDVSEFMKTLKQRFTIWFNQINGRYGPLWSDRFKSVLVEGRGNPLQTMAAYIDLNPVRAGIVDDPKDYRFCGYAEAVARSPLSAGLGRAHPMGSGEARSAGSGQARSTGSGQAGEARFGEEAVFSRAWTARQGICHIWRAYADGSPQAALTEEEALKTHRTFLFSKRAGEAGLPEFSREKALRILQRDGVLPRTTVLRCRVRYFTDGAILGSREFVHSFVATWQKEKQRKFPPKPVSLPGADWEGLTAMQQVRRSAFG